MQAQVNGPTDLFTNLEPQYQEMGNYYAVGQERRATDFEAPKLWKGRSGALWVHWQVGLATWSEESTELACGKIALTPNRTPIICTHELLLQSG